MHVYRVLNIRALEKDNLRGGGSESTVRGAVLYKVARKDLAEGREGMSLAKIQRKRVLGSARSGRVEICLACSTNTKELA